MFISRFFFPFLAKKKDSIISCACACASSHYVRFSWFYWHFWANIVMHIWSMLQVCIIAIWSQGLILNSGRSYFGYMQLLAPGYLIHGLFWVQNGKNDYLQKMSVESWKSCIVIYLPITYSLLTWLQLLWWPQNSCLTACSCRRGTNHWASNAGHGTP